LHSQEAKELLEKFVIGTVKAGAKAAKQAPATISVTDMAAAAAADPSKPKVRPSSALLLMGRMSGQNVSSKRAG
jgi:hypothetical protein